MTEAAQKKETFLYKQHENRMLMTQFFKDNPYEPSEQAYLQVLLVFSNPIHSPLLFQLFKTSRP